MSSLTPNGPLVRQFYNLYFNFPELPTISYTFLNDQGGQVTFSFPNCREKKLDRKGERQTSFLSSDNVTIWQIPKESLDSSGASDAGVLEPDLNGFITGPDGQQWNILHVRKQLMGQVFNCYCEAITAPENEDLA